MADHDIEDRIKLVLSREAMVERKPADIPGNANLIDDLGLDSVRIVELIVGIEDEFGIVIADEDLSLELFESVTSLATFIRSRISINLPGTEECSPRHDRSPQLDGSCRIHPSET